MSGTNLWRRRRDGMRLQTLPSTRSGPPSSSPRSVESALKSQSKAKSRNSGTFLVFGFVRKGPTGSCFDTGGLKRRHVGTREGRKGLYLRQRPRQRSHPSPEIKDKKQAQHADFCQASRDYSRFRVDLASQHLSVCETIYSVISGTDVGCAASR
eukprot:799025-Rhodomonas_salina.2